VLYSTTTNQPIIQSISQSVSPSVSQSIEQLLKQPRASIHPTKEAKTGGNSCTPTPTMRVPQQQQGTQVNEWVSGWGNVGRHLQAKETLTGRLAFDQRVPTKIAVMSERMVPKNHCDSDRRPPTGSSSPRSCCQNEKEQTTCCLFLSLLNVFFWN